MEIPVKIQDEYISQMVDMFHLNRYNCPMNGNAAILQNRWAAYPNRLRQLRLAHNMTLKELGNLLEVSPQAIHKAEVSGQGLSRKNWYKLADLFNIDPRLLETPS